MKCAFCGDKIVPYRHVDYWSVRRNGRQLYMHNLCYKKFIAQEKEETGNDK